MTPPRREPGPALTRFAFGGTATAPETGSRFRADAVPIGRRLP